MTFVRTPATPRKHFGSALTRFWGPPLCLVWLAQVRLLRFWPQFAIRDRFHSYLVGRRFRMGPGKWRGWSRSVLACHAGSTGTVGDRYVRLEIARSIESYSPQCGPATYSYNNPRFGYWSSMGKTRLFTGFASPLATLTYSR